MQTAPEAQAPVPQAVPGEQTELRIDEPVRLDEAPPIPEPQEDDAPAEGRKPGRHDTQMESIVARRRERLARELDEARAQGFQQPEPQEPTAPQVPPAIATTPNAPQPGAAPAGDVAPVPAPTGQPTAGRPEASPSLDGTGAALPPGEPQIRRHKVMVRGQQYELADDEVRRAAELGIESEARIRHAHQMMQEAQQLAATAQQQINFLRAGQSPPEAPQQAPPPPVQDEALQVLAKELLYGDEQRVTAALGQLLQLRQQAPPAPEYPDPNLLANEVYNRIDQRLNIENSLQRFAREFPDIVADPDKSLLCANYVLALRQHYQSIQTPRSEWDLYNEAGIVTRNKLNGWGQPQQPQVQPAQQQQPPQSLPMQNGNRLTIKRNMPQAPNAAAAQSAPAERPAPSPRDVINWMRRTRGQPELPPIH